jgi:hypothetical protein
MKTIWKTSPQSPIQSKIDLLLELKKKRTKINIVGLSGGLMIKDVSQGYDDGYEIITQVGTDMIIIERHIFEKDAHGFDMVDKYGTKISHFSSVLFYSIDAIYCIDPQ